MLLRYCALGHFVPGAERKEVVKVGDFTARPSDDYDGQFLSVLIMSKRYCRPINADGGGTIALTIGIRLRIPFGTYI